MINESVSMKHYHFIGIGGIGMGTLASLLLDKGFRVSGSDVKDNELTALLRKKGAKIFIGHSVENIKGAHCIVHSSAIRVTNPEMIQAVSLQIPLLRRAELLAELVNAQTGITIAGAHGKTTTTSMVSNMLLKAGLNPTTAVGGIINGDTAYNANLGGGQYFVAEADESDGTFLYFEPQYSIITNIDFEHVDFYKNWDNIIAAYRKFIQRTRRGGCVIICGEDPRLKELVANENIQSLTYGFSPQFDVHAENVVNEGYSTRFDCYYRSKALGAIDLVVPGRHNVLNALATIALGITLNIPFETMASSLQTFYGVKRRFQLKGNFDDIMVIDDYGHHPTEIMATLSAAKSFNRKRVVVAFQPHRYSRTKFLMDEFVKSFKLSDYLVITDVYAASEKPSEGADIQELYAKIHAEYGEAAVYLKKEKIVEHLLEAVRPGDLLLTLGAGDITQLSDQFIAAWQARQSFKSQKLNA
jgi:UDP-N-acetylmuramate--alanine ligase